MYTYKPPQTSLNKAHETHLAPVPDLDDKGGDDAVLEEVAGLGKELHHDVVVTIIFVVFVCILGCGCGIDPSRFSVARDAVRSGFDARPHTHKTHTFNAHTCAYYINENAKPQSAPEVEVLEVGGAPQLLHPVRHLFVFVFCFLGGQMLVVIVLVGCWMEG